MGIPRASKPQFAIKTIIKFINQPWSIGSPVMEVSVSSWGYPSIIHSNKIFPYKPWNTPSSYWGSPMTLETPITIRNIICINMCHCWNNNMCHPFNDDGWNHNNGLWMTTYLETNRYVFFYYFGDLFILPSGYLTWPWKITMLLIGQSSISMDHLYHGELLVITRGYIPFISHWITINLIKSL